MRRIDTFCQGNRQVGRRFRYPDGQRILEILREAHCPIEDHNLVKNCVAECRPALSAAATHPRASPLCRFCADLSPFIRFT